MSMPITFEMRVQGAEEVKQRLQEVQSQFQSGEINTHQYATELRGVSRDANALNNDLRIQTSVFLSLHPVLNDVSRAMTVFGSVARAVSSSLQLITLAQIAMNTADSGTAQAKADLAQALRDQAEAYKKFGEDSQQYLDATDKVNVANARLKDVIQQTDKANQLMWVNLVVGVITTSSVVIAQLPKMIEVFSKLGTTLSGLGIGSLGATLGGLVTTLGPLALLAAAVFAVYLDIKMLYDLLTDMATGKAGSLSYWYYSDVEPTIGRLSDFFTKTLPNIVITGINIVGSTLTNGLNTLVQGLVGFVNGVISSANAILSRLHMPTLPMLTPPTPFAFQPIPLVGQSSSNQSGGQKFTNGISPMTNPGIAGGGNTNITQITVQGSIITENDIQKMFEKWLKDGLLAVGFR